MYKGIHHIGVGVSDMSAALPFYRDCLGFSDVLFDYTGLLPGMEKVTGKPNTNARVVMLANPRMGNFGLGMIKLVELLPPDKPEPLPDGLGWGEIGVSEICLQVYNAKDVMKDLVEEKGCKLAMDMLELEWEFSDTEMAKMFYVWDPYGGKVEFIEVPCLGDQPRIMGVYHVGFGVSDAVKSAEFYKELGFTELMWDFQGVIDPMTDWHGKPQEMKIIMLGNFRGAGLEMVQHIPELKDCRGTWGHLGPMDFAIEVTNIDKACEVLKGKGIELLSEVNTIDVKGGQWRYVYFADPDNNYVALTEQRY